MVVVTWLYLIAMAFLLPLEKMREEDVIDALMPTFVQIGVKLASVYRSNALASQTDKGSCLNCSF